MKQVTQDARSGEIRVEEIPVPALKPGFVLVRTWYSIISPGTEKATIGSKRSSLAGRAMKNPDLVRRVLEQIRQYGLLPTIQRVRARLNQRGALGYSLSGEVVAVGEQVREFSPGTIVACAGAGYASHAEYVLVPKNLCVKVPRGVEAEEAASTTIGAIALQGVRQANPTVGETIVVIGLGIVGQLTVQILKANGCVVVGVDLDPFHVKLAKQCGADASLLRHSGDVAKVVQSMTHGVGADAVIIAAATSSNDPVELAGELCREKGRVVLVGDVGLQLPRGPYYMKELDFRLSRFADLFVHGAENTVYKPSTVFSAKILCEFNGLIDRNLGRHFTTIRKEKLIQAKPKNVSINRRNPFYRPLGRCFLYDLVEIVALFEYAGEKRCHK